METNATKRTDIFLIDPRNIVVMEGFNVRIDFDLEELKEQIKVAGELNPSPLSLSRMRRATRNTSWWMVKGVTVQPCWL